MINLDSQQFELCKVQGQLFERILQEEYDCKAFIEQFMNSQVARALDDTYDRLQWLGEAYIIEELDEEVNGLKRAGHVYHNEVMYWTGYVYRYWHYYTGESSKEIYQIADAETKVMYGEEDR